MPMELTTTHVFYTKCDRSNRQTNKKKINNEKKVHVVKNRFCSSHHQTLLCVTNVDPGRSTASQSSSCSLCMLSPSACPPARLGPAREEPLAEKAQRARRSEYERAREGDPDYPPRELRVLLLRVQEVVG